MGTDGTLHSSITPCVHPQPPLPLHLAPICSLTCSSQLCHHLVPPSCLWQWRMWGHMSTCFHSQKRRWGTCFYPYEGGSSKGDDFRHHFLLNQVWQSNQMLALTGPACQLIFTLDQGWTLMTCRLDSSRKNTHFPGLMGTWVMHVTDLGTDSWLRVLAKRSHDLFGAYLYLTIGSWGLEDLWIGVAIDEAIGGENGRKCFWQEVPFWWCKAPLESMPIIEACKKASKTKIFTG